MWLLNKLVKQVLRMRWLSRPRSEALEIPGCLDGFLLGESLSPLWLDLHAKHLCWRSWKASCRVLFRHPPRTFMLHLL